VKEGLKLSLKNKYEVNPNMKRAKITAFQLLILTGFIYLSSCAIVTVNVYFPAEEVRKAYENLEEELVKPPQEKSTEPQKTPKKENLEGQPQSLREYPEKPQLESRKVIVLKRRFSLDMSAPAFAQGDIAEQIAEEIRNMPEVVEAFRRMGPRLGILDNMRSEGKVGEGNKGLLVERGTLTGDERAAFNAENSDRGIIIKGMARAIVKINKLEPTSDNINRVLPQAAEQFATVRRDKAQSGWFIQLRDGSWVQK
jgi:DNA-binding Lrp family transcriptional regulator